MRMIRRRVSRSSIAELSKSQSPHSQQLSNSIVQPQRGDTALTPGERREPLGEPSVTRGLGSMENAVSSSVGHFKLSSFEPQDP